jgi:hypothetical protein
MPTIQVLRRPMQWSNLEDAVARLDSKQIEHWQNAVGLDPENPDPLLILTAQICAVARDADFQELVCIPGTREWHANNAPRLEKLVVQYCPQLIASKQGPKLQFTAA